MILSAQRPVTVNVRKRTYETFSTMFLNYDLLVRAYDAWWHKTQPIDDAVLDAEARNGG